MDCLVVGAGAMGRWFAEALDETIEDLAFADADPEIASEAAAAYDARVAEDGETFELVCIAVPLPAAAEAIAANADRVESAICDVTGSMIEPVEAMNEHCPDAERLSLHPLFAPASAPGSIAVVEAESGPIAQRIRDALIADGNRLFDTTPAEHDEAMETVQARAHAAVLAFALSAEDVPTKFQTPVSAGLFDLVSQVADGEARVYADIQEAFDGADDVAEAAAEIADADPERFKELYERVR